MKFLLVLALVIQATITFSAAPRDGGTYKIVSKSCGLVLGISTSGEPTLRILADIALVAQPDNGSDDQKFIMHQDIPNVFFMENMTTGLYVSNESVSPILAPFNPSGINQSYQLIPVGGFFMIAPGENLTSVMTVSPDGSLSFQPPVGPIGAANQLFSFTCSR